MTELEEILYGTRKEEGFEAWQQVSTTMYM
jgi:hypothetical protein